MSIQYLKTRSGDVIGITEEDLFVLAGVSSKTKDVASLFGGNARLAGTYFLVDRKAYDEAQKKQGVDFGLVKEAPKAKKSKEVEVEQPETEQPEQPNIKL